MMPELAQHDKNPPLSPFFKGGCHGVPPLAKGGGGGFKKPHAKRISLNGNSRGVALLIALLVTALLIALIFEFAYNTRVSLRAAVNFRDSQRAYFLARSAVNVFARFKELQDMIPHGELREVPGISEGDTVVKLKWEDERGKLNINAIDSKPGADWVDQLFGNLSVATDVYDKVKEKRKEGRFNLITELHAVMSDEDYGKVARFLSVYYSDNIVNLNTASEVVLISLGFGKGAAKTIAELRSLEPFKDIEKIKPYQPANLSLSSQNLTSSVFYVYSLATVGGYTRTVEAIIDRSSNTTKYWRAL